MQQAGDASRSWLCIKPLPRALDEGVLEYTKEAVKGGSKPLAVTPGEIKSSRQVGLPVLPQERSTQQQL